MALLLGEEDLVANHMFDQSLLSKVRFMSRAHLAVYEGKFSSDLLISCWYNKEISPLMCGHLYISVQIESFD